MFKKVILLLPLIFILQCTLPEIQDITPPVAIVIYPYEGAVVSANVDVLISASDDEEVTKVWYYLNGEEVGSSKTSPYVIPLNITGLEKKVNHVIQAAAKDKDGNIGYSPLTNFTVAETEDIIDPVVAIVNPQGGQVVEGIVNLVAFAEDERSIQKVAFFVNGDSLGISTTYPYTYNWDTATYSDSTQHTIYAKAWDGGNNVAISPVISVTVYPRTGEAGDFTPPAALFLYPITGSTVAGIVTVALDIADDDSLDKIEFYVDGILEATTSKPTSPWTYDWDTSTKADSLPHNLYIKVYDRAGNLGTATSTVTIFSEIGVVDPDITPPTAQFLYPIEESTLNGMVQVAVDIADDESLSKIEFYVDGILETSTNNPSSPWLYDWDTTPYADSQVHTLYIKVYDGAGNIGTTTSTVTIAADEPDITAPTALILYPIGESTVTGNVSVSVDLFDNVGVTRAEFYVDGALVTQANNPSIPWIFTWNTTADGLLHSIYIKAFDAAGNIGTSGLLTVTTN